MLHRWGIQSRVMLLTLLPAATTAVLLTTYFAYAQIQDLDRSLLERGASIARQLAPAAEYGVFSGNPDVLRPLLQATLDQSDVRAISVTDATGRPVAWVGPAILPAAHLPASPSEATMANSDSGRTHVFRVPVRQMELAIDEPDATGATSALRPSAPPGRILGWVTVELSRAQTDARQEQVLLSSVLIIILCLVCTVVLGSRMGRDVSEPILELTDAVRRVEQGDFNVQVETHAGGELATLESGLNAMTRALKASRGNLQERIDQATGQLRATLKVLEEKNVALENARREAERANRVKSEFLAGMSHELRTPLHAVIGFSEVLKERLFGELNAKQAEYVDDIHGSGRHLLALINDLLDISKIEAGRMEIEPTRFDLGVALQEALNFFKERAARRAITLAVSQDPTLTTIVADERKFKEILLNLLSNAIKYTPEGGRVEVRAWPGAGEICIAVSDTGIGIPPEEHQAIFQEFHQVKRHDRESRVEGTGLGLTLTRRFVELHGGRISVESEVGRGTTFTFTVPVRT